jgi:hypothetical protein
MRTILVSIILASLLGFSSCKKDDNSTLSTITEVSSAVSSGTWRITYFMDSGTNKTNLFTGYAFTFNSNGSISAVNGLTIINGTWSVTNSSDDDNTNDIDFNILFTTPASFEDLSDDWDILEATNAKIKLVDVSGGNGGTDYLTFEKN